MLLQFAPAVGTRQYDWNRKQVRCNDSSGDLRKTGNAIFESAPKSSLEWDLLTSYHKGKGNEDWW